MFDPEMYALLNPDLKRAGINTPEKLRTHWLRRGKKEHRPIRFRQKFPHFRPDQYQKNYPELAGMSLPDLEMHWLKVGFRQQRTYYPIITNPKTGKIMNQNHILIFTEIYEKEKWGKSEYEDFRGSPGELSRLDYNVGSFIPFIRKLIENNNIKSIVDIGCGNFDWARPIYEDLFHLNYIGYEAYKDLVSHNQKNHPDFRFEHLDAFNNKERLESADLCILKDVLEHWSNKEIVNFLDYLVLSKKYKYILIVNGCRQKEDNNDTVTGGFRELAHNYLPLKKYNIKKLYDFSIKEVSMIFT